VTLPLYFFCPYWCFRSSYSLYSVDSLRLVWRGFPFHLLFYDHVIMKTFKAIIVLSGYANTLHLTLWTQNLKPWPYKSFSIQEVLKSVTIHTSLRAGPAHGFVTVAPSLATGPVRCNLVAIRSLWPVLLQRLFEDWEVTALRVYRRSFLGALNLWQPAVVIEGVNGQMRRDDGLSSHPINLTRAQCPKPLNTVHILYTQN